MDVSIDCSVATADTSTSADSKADFSVEISRLIRVISLRRSFIVGNGSPSVVKLSAVDLVSRRAGALSAQIFKCYLLYFPMKESDLMFWVFLKM